MKVLALRTDKAQAELYIYDSGKKLAQLKWQAHLKLAETLNTKITEILNPGTKISKLHNPITDYSARDLVRGRHDSPYDLLDGIAIYKGPGSFTGLRIGMSVANAIAYAQNIPIIAKSGDTWLQDSIKALQTGKDDKIVTPEYGAPARTTIPHK